MTAAIMGSTHMEFIYQHQLPRRMSGPVISPLKPNMYKDERRFSVQTPQCISSFPNQTLPHNNQNLCRKASGMTSYYHYADQKTPLRSTNSLPIGLHTSQQNLINANHMQLQRTSSHKLEPAQTALESERYKTELCRPYEETGECRYGTKCQFAHGMRELRSLNRHPKYRTTLCRTYHTTGYCSYGQRCNFIHNEDERRGSLPATLPSSRPKIFQISDKPCLAGSSTGDSPASSMTSGSPTHSPCYLDDDVYPNLPFSPSPTFSSSDELAENKFFGRSSYIAGDELMLNFDLQNLALL